MLFPSTWTKRTLSQLHLANTTAARAVSALAFGCLVLGFLLFSSNISSRHGDEGIRQSATTVQGHSTCNNTARLDPHGIEAPLKPDTAAIMSIWPGLKQALVENGKDLPTLVRPGFQRAFPSEDAIRTRTRLLTQDQASLIRERHASFVRDIPSYPSDTFKGRGIVMLAGGRYSEFAAIALGVLRETGSKLPVEVWHRDEREEKHGWCDELAGEGMACRRLSDYLDTDLLEIKDGKEMKVFTMLFSSFEEIVFIDADNMALQSPELLFESEGFRSTGAILWPDFRKYDNIDWLDYAVGLTDDRSETLWNQTTFESGQIAWNKCQNWEALLLATYYNYHGPDLYYTLLNHGFAGWGDKDTFPLALRALNKPFYAIPDAPQSVWVNGKVDKRRAGMLQMAPKASDDVQTKPHAFFLHTTTTKWSHRDFMCDRCLPVWHTESLTDAFKSRWEDGKAELHKQLSTNIRIMDPDMLVYLPQGKDAEIVVWRAMEHAACRSKAWRHERTCQVVRGYMRNAFGFSFTLLGAPRKSNDTEVGPPDFLAEACLVDPS